MWEGAYRASDLRRDLPIGLRGKNCIPRTCMIVLERAEGDQRDELVKERKKREKDENKQVTIYIHIYVRKKEENINSNIVDIL